MSQIPESHSDLIDGPVVVMLATVMPDGRPQVTPVWADQHDGQIWVNSAKGRQKDRNLRLRPFATVAATDPENPYRWIEIRGSVTEVVEGAVAYDHINSLSHQYVGRDFTLASPDEIRVIYKIQPQRVNIGD